MRRPRCALTLGKRRKETFATEIKKSLDEIDKSTANTDSSAVPPELRPIAP